MPVRLLLAAVFLTGFVFSAVRLSAQSEALPENKPDTVPVMRYRITDGLEYVYTKPKAFEFAGHIIPNTGKYFTRTFSRKNFIYIGAMAVGTTFLYFRDRTITDAAQNLGNDIGLSHTNNEKTYGKCTIHLGNFRQSFPINGPYDASTWMFFLGDGFAHPTIAGGFWVAGIIGKDFRARQTASQIMEAIITTGILVQLGKHISGKERPMTSQPSSLGQWRPLSNQAEYVKHVTHFDAFPSGHMASAMATVTVIAENYPEYHFIRPLGYSLMGVLGFAMLNNGVHWLSDYPLGISIGYTCAKIAVDRGRKIVEKKKDTEDSLPQHSKRGKFSLLPDLSDSENGLTILYTF